MASISRGDPEGDKESLTISTVDAEDAKGSCGASGDDREEDDGSSLECAWSGSNLLPANDGIACAVEADSPDELEERVLRGEAWRELGGNAIARARGRRTKLEEWHGNRHMTSSLRS